MSLPPHLGSIQDIKEREAKAFNTQAMWHDQLQDVYEYFLPQRNLFDREDKGQKKNCAQRKQDCAVKDTIFMADHSKAVKHY